MRRRRKIFRFRYCNLRKNLFFNEVFAICHQENINQQVYFHSYNWTKFHGTPNQAAIYQIFVQNLFIPLNMVQTARAVQIESKQRKEKDCCESAKFFAIPIKNMEFIMILIIHSSSYRIRYSAYELQQENTVEYGILTGEKFIGKNIVKLVFFFTKFALFMISEM